MDMDDFNYLEGTLTEWVEKYSQLDQPTVDLMLDIEKEYVPRFEAAIHRLHSTNNSTWTHPAITRLPLTVVTGDEEFSARTESIKQRVEDYEKTISHAQDMISEGGRVMLVGSESDPHAPFPEIFKQERVR